MVAAEADPLDTRPLSEMESVVAEGMMTPAGLRLLNEIVRRYLWEEGEGGF